MIQPLIVKQIKTEEYAFKALYRNDSLKDSKKNAPFHALDMFKYYQYTLKHFQFYFFYIWMKFIDGIL